MTNSPDKETGKNQGPPPAEAHWLLQPKTRRGIRSPHFWIIFSLFAVFTYIYYGVMTAYQDIYVVIFFYPLAYAAFVYRMRGVIIGGLLFLGILLVNTFVFNYDNYDVLSLLRTLLFASFVFLISSLGATLLNYLEHQIESNREILSLNNELNDTIERLQTTQQQLIQAARLSYIGQLSAGVAHELNNPIAGILVYIRLMKEKLAKGNCDKEQLRGILEKVESAIDYCTGIIRGLLDFARQSEPRLGPVTVGRAVDKAMSLVGHQARAKAIEVVRDETPGLPLVVADFNQLVQVFINLVLNAVQAMDSGGRLTIHTEAEDRWVRIIVGDTGRGISPENLEKLFTPFFTTRGDEKGVGLGLAVSYGIIENHGGRIEVKSEVGKGSVFTIFLPAYRGSAPTGPAG